MIDTFLKNIPWLVSQIFDRIGLKNSKYFVLTIHRPTNVDDKGRLLNLLDEIVSNSNNLPIIFPVHPRTKKNLNNVSFSNLYMVEPMNYLSFNYLVKNSKAVITDSGGITEETTVLGIPCITLRDTTERPETCDLGTNELIGTDPKAIKPVLEKLFRGEWKKGKIPPLWYGKAADRIVQVLKTL